MHSIAVLLSALALVNCASIGEKPFEDKRIVGGFETNIETYPHQVSIEYYGTHLCGGSIISNTIILTAAHCTYGAFASELTIRAGSTFQSVGGETHGVISIVQHEWYDPYGMENDISILRLIRPLTFGPGISPIALAIDRPPVNTTVMTCGWGATNEGGYPSWKLRAVAVPILHKFSCQEMYYPDFDITDRMICASSTGKDRCQGDSGGPLIDQGNWSLLGIASWGAGCGYPDSPGVYTSVPKLREWILKYSC